MDDQCWNCLGGTKFKGLALCPHEQLPNGYSNFHTRPQRITLGHNSLVGIGTYLGTRVPNCDSSVRTCFLRSGTVRKELIERVHVAGQSVRHILSSLSSDLHADFGPCLTPLSGYPILFHSKVLINQIFNLRFIAMPGMG